MEQTANNNPRSATAQNAFYSSLLRANRPDLVVQRYESGNFASNPACEALYMRALERTNQALTGSTNPLSAGVDGKGELSPAEIRGIAQSVAGHVHGGTAVS